MDGRSTREAAIEAARELLVDEGFVQLSMRRVAGRVGVSAPALYRHFDSKEALVWAVVAQGYRVFIDYLAGALAADSPLERFRECGRCYFRFAREQSGYYALIFGFSERDFGFRDIPDSVCQQGDVAFQMLVDRIRECIDAKLFTDDPPQSLALFVWAETHGLASLRLAGRISQLPDGAFDAEVERAIERLVHALRR